MTLQDRLDKMCNHTFMVNGLYHKILSYRIRNGSVTLATDNGWIELETATAEKQLREFLPVARDNQEPLHMVVHDKKTMLNLRDIVVDNIKKVQEDKEYVPQAHAINKSINTLIQMAKMEISVFKAMKEEG